MCSVCTVPKPWRQWVEAHRYEALISPRTTEIRSKDEQLPQDDKGFELLSTIREHFRGRESLFEAVAVEIWRLIAPATGKCEITRPSRDGGMDAIGEYLIGPAGDRVAIQFALEAKCYESSHSVGVRDVSRLIARLRIRQFGVFVTTSFFNSQVYEEVRTDGHPLVLVCGRDIVGALQRAGLSDRRSLHKWLTSVIGD